MQQYGQHRAVHAAGDAADDLLVPDLGADVLDKLALEVADVEGGELLGVGKEVAEDGAAFVRMGYLRVELNAEHGLAPLQGDGHAFAVAGDDAAALG